MPSLPLPFAADGSPSGISALGLDLKSFLFQLVTFVIVLLVLRRYVFTRLVATLEKRRSVLEQSLVQAKKTEEALKNAEHKASEVLKAARDQADQALSDAAKQAQEVIATAEAGGTKRAERIIADAEQHLTQERDKLRAELKGELVELVAAATEMVVGQRLDAKGDDALIKKSIEEVRK